ncbi:MAG: SMC family ATPase, partial [Dehalococcoidia bacterium]
MRPLELVVHGFRSYAEETRFDWRDRQLVGVVGPIGSGKSSILDAIAFALYGRTPAIGSGTRGLINQRAAMAQVQLTFRVDGTAWQVIRAVKAKGASQHALYPFDEATWLPDQGQAITGDRAVTERVEQVLGLDFAGFQRSVLLAQNRFSEFLNATPGERDQVLKGVFGLDRIDAMQTLARERQRDAERDGEDLRRRLAEVAEARTRLDERRTQQQTLAARRVALDALRPRVEELDRAEREAQEAAARAAKRVTELDEMRQGLPPREQSQATLATFQQHSTDGAALAEARERAETAAAEARSA